VLCMADTRAHPPEAGDPLCSFFKCLDRALEAIRSRFDAVFGCRLSRNKWVKGRRVGTPPYRVLRLMAVIDINAA
jgi:hypothetical protein